MAQIADLSIHLRGPIDDAVLREEGLSSALPQDYRTTVPIFSSVTEVHAQARQSENLLVAYGPPTVSTRSVDDSLSARPLFAAAPIEVLRIDIGSYQVHCVKWRTVLDHFTLLRELSITALGNPPIPKPVLDAIKLVPASLEVVDFVCGRVVANAYQRAPCPRLQVVRIRGFRAIEDSWDRKPWNRNAPLTFCSVYECLSERIRDGPEALEEDAQKWATAGQRARDCESVLVSRGLVGKVEYKERQNWPNLYTYEDV
ncbi:hypothetical protein K466DRAFT_600184 [Polyporus arcularius HHB13444]|uniref:Uncharacterized protein n=1 Tax=Polyporus arcularius HHB13444 TaxID=1314778 RepID=A0A5C3PA54_9APHY|nr:hypothetical protein K466DRAFT_600184 [Polyporus arcularius HHB13444]